MGSCCCVHASKAPTSITEHSGLASYGAIIQKIRPGDIILFRNSHAQAAAQRLFCGTDWDHVGLVVQDYHCGEDGVPCCGQDTKAWQAERREKKPSDPWGRPWHTLEAMSNGVDVYPFSSEQVKHFRGVQSVRRLHIPPERRPAAEARLTEFVDQVKGMPYSKTVLTLVRAANYFGTNDLEGDLQCFFCSELVAAAYKAMGVLEPSRNCNMYIPGDFSTTGDPARAATLVEGCRLGGEVIVEPFHGEDKFSTSFYKSHALFPLGNTKAIELDAATPRPSDDVFGTPCGPAATPSVHDFGGRANSLTPIKGRIHIEPPPISSPWGAPETPSRFGELRTPLCPLSSPSALAREHDHGGGVWSTARRGVHILPPLDDRTLKAQELFDAGLQARLGGHLSPKGSAELQESTKLEQSSLKQRSRATDTEGARVLREGIAKVEEQVEAFWNSQVLCPKRLDDATINPSDFAQNSTPMHTIAQNGTSKNTVAPNSTGFRLPGEVFSGGSPHIAAPATPRTPVGDNGWDGAATAESTLTVDTASTVAASHFGTVVTVPLEDGPLQFDDLVDPGSASSDRGGHSLDLLTP